MLYGTQVKHKEMNLNVPSWFAILPFCTVSAVRKGKNLQRICRHSAKCSKTWLKSGPTRLSLLWYWWGCRQISYPINVVRMGNFVIFEVLLAKKVL